VQPRVEHSAVLTYAGQTAVAHATIGHHDHAVRVAAESAFLALFP